MTLSTSLRNSGMNRRAAVAGLGVAATFGIGRAALPAQAQEAGLADHPMTGTWLVQANPLLPDDPQIVNVALFASDGTVLLLMPATQRGPQGVVFTTPHVGVWEADGERRAHFTATQILSAADGAQLGTVTVDGYPEADETGQVFVDDGSHVTVTIRDATGAIVEQIMPTGQPVGRPVTGVRMAVGVSDFPEAANVATATA